MYSLGRLGVGLMLAILTTSLARTDEPAKAQFQTTKLETLSNTGKFDWSKTEFLDALNGDEGWEALLTSVHVALFRETEDSPKWEYKAVKIKNSPFASTGTKDTNACALILDRLGSDGYVPCAVSGLGEYRKSTGKALETPLHASPSTTKA